MLFRLLLILDLLGAAVFSFFLFAALSIHAPASRGLTAAAIFLLLAGAVFAGAVFLKRSGYLRSANTLLLIPASGLFVLAIYVLGLFIGS